MKKRYELQMWNFHTSRWRRALADYDYKTLKSKVLRASQWGYGRRVVQKLGRKVIKVVYPKGK